MEDPGLPIKLGPCSNGEYPPQPTTEVVRQTVRRARRMAEENAKRLGMDRRSFLLSSMGAATTLYALAACSSDDKKASNESGGGDEGPGGTFEVSEDALIDADVAFDELGGKQPIIDMQTHLLEYPNDYTGFHLGSLWEQFKDCEDRDLDECFNAQAWMEEIFGRSDTTLAVLSALPVVAAIDPLSAEIMDSARRDLVQLCGDGRVLVQGHAWVNVGDPAEALEKMEAELENFPISAWKTYTHVGTGFSLDDHIGIPVGESYLAKVEEIGPPIVCVHKGFGNVGDAPFADPADIGPAATNHPDLTFCIYHSGYEAGGPEGPYDSANPGGGVDRLVKTLELHDIGHDGNVYAEIGSTWKVAMTSPDTAAHILGKLLVAVGPDRILWGTDSLWYGTPQDQIQAFRAFQITPEFQERFGYPELTDEIKDKIFWRNAARLMDIDVANVPCELDAEEREQARIASPLNNRTYGPTTAAEASALFRAEHPWAFMK